MMTEIADWISALAALGALVAAVWAAKVSKRLYQIEADRGLVASERDEKEQASAIAAWCLSFTDDSDAETKRGLQIHNSSDAPVFDISVRSTYASSKNGAAEAVRALELSILPPGDYTVRRHPVYQWDFPEERSVEGRSVRPVMNNPKWAVEEIRFTDAHGMRWSRAGGALRKLIDS